MKNGHFMIKLFVFLFILISLFNFTCYAADFTITTTADFDAGTKNGTATVTDIANVPSGQLQKDVDSYNVTLFWETLSSNTAFVGRLVGDSVERVVAQSFNSTKGNIIKTIRVYMDSITGTPSNITVDIVSSTNAGVPNTSDVLASTNSIAYSDVALAKYNNFTLTKPLYYEPNTNYFIYIRTVSNNTGGNYYLIGRQITNPRFRNGWFFWIDGDNNTWHNNSAHDLSIYVIGSDYGGEIKKTDFYYNTSEQSYLSAVIGNSTYNTGGYGATGSRDDWWEYNLTNDSFIIKQNLSSDRHAGAAVGYNGNVFYIGGREVNFSIKNEFYNVSSNSWTTKENMTYPVGDMGAIVYGDIIYVFGGQGQGADYNVSVRNYTQIYNITSDSWSLGAEMPGKRRNTWPVEINGLVYVFGGSAINNPYTEEKTMFIYNISNDSWSQGKNASVGLGYYIPIVDGTNILYFGGEDSEYPSAGSGGMINGIIWKYDTINDKWKEYGLCLEKSWGFGFEINNQTHIVAGFKNPFRKRTKSHYIVNVLTNATWESANQTMTLGKRLKNTTIHHSNLSTNSFIAKVEWLVGGTVKATYDIDIKSGSSTTITNSVLTSGSFGNVTDNFTIKVTLSSLGNSTPVITQIEGDYETYCGNGECDSGESCSTCSADCGGCGGGLPPTPPKPECSVCPEPNEWSECINNSQSRTVWYCDRSTYYRCRNQTEIQSCEIGVINVSEIEEVIQDANNTINQAREENKNVSEAEGLFSQALSAFNAGDYNLAKALAEQAKKAALGAEVIGVPTKAAYDYLSLLIVSIALVIIVMTGVVLYKRTWVTF